MAQTFTLASTSIAFTTISNAHDGSGDQWAGSGNGMITDDGQGIMLILGNHTRYSLDAGATWNSGTLLNNDVGIQSISKDLQKVVFRRPQSMSFFTPTFYFSTDYGQTFPNSFPSDTDSLRNIGFDLSGNYHYFNRFNTNAYSTTNGASSVVTHQLAEGAYQGDCGSVGGNPILRCAVTFYKDNPLYGATWNSNNQNGFWTAAKTSDMGTSYTIFSNITAGTGSGPNPLSAFTGPSNSFSILTPPDHFNTKYLVRGLDTGFNSHWYSTDDNGVSFNYLTDLSYPTASTLQIDQMEWGATNGNLLFSSVKTGVNSASIAASEDFGQNWYIFNNTTQTTSNRPVLLAASPNKRYLVYTKLSDNDTDLWLIDTQSSNPTPPPPPGYPPPPAGGPAGYGGALWSSEDPLSPPNRDETFWSRHLRMYSQDLK